MRPREHYGDDLAIWPQVLTDWGSVMGGFLALVAGLV
jgi:hypothetical protein